LNLDLVNRVFNDVKKNKSIKNFIKELQNYLEKKANKDIVKEDDFLFER